MLYNSLLWGDLFLRLLGHVSLKKGVCKNSWFWLLHCSIYVGYPIPKMQGKQLRRCGGQVGGNWSIIWICRVVHRQLYPSWTMQLQENIGLLPGFSFGLETLMLSILTGVMFYLFAIAAWPRGYHCGQLSSPQPFLGRDRRCFRWTCGQAVDPLLGWTRTPPDPETCLPPSFSPTISKSQECRIQLHWPQWPGRGQMSLCGALWDPCGHVSRCQSVWEI